MNCKACGAELEEGAVFCSSCGARADGKKKCLECATWNNEEATYCARCGARLDGKKQCYNCGKLLETDEAFCTQCGTRAGERKISPRTDAKRFRGVWGVVRESISVGIAVTALLFVLLMGLTTTQTSLSGATLRNSEFLYGFFGSAYKDMGELLGAMEKYSGVFELSMYLPLALVTAIYAAAIIAVATLSIVSIVRGIKRLTGKSEKSGSKLSLASFAVFLGGALAVLATMGSYTRERGSVNTIGLSGATIAGIVVCAVLVAGYVTVSVIERRRELFAGESLVSTSLAFASLALVVVLTVLASLKLYTLSEQSTKASCGAAVLLMSFGEINVVSDGNGAGAMIATSIITLVMQFGLIACVSLLWVTLASYFGGMKSNFAVISVVTAAVAVILLVISVINGMVFIKSVRSGMAVAGASSPMNYAVPIVLCVFALINAAIAIVQRIMSKPLPTGEGEPNYAAN